MLSHSVLCIAAGLTVVSLQELQSAAVAVEQLAICPGSAPTGVEALQCAWPLALGRWAAGGHEGS